MGIGEEEKQRSRERGMGSSWIWEHNLSADGERPLGRRLGHVSWVQEAHATRGCGPQQERDVLSERLVVVFTGPTFSTRDPGQSQAQLSLPCCRLHPTPSICSHYSCLSHFLSCMQTKNKN